ncbi:MAG: hypothetical protein ACK4S4_05800 [Pyrinomonadaceae bacterium]
MSISELVIIYLTCGTPVAAGRLLSAHGNVRSKDVFFAFCYLIIWPAVALSFIKREVADRFVSNASNAYSSAPDISDSAFAADRSEKIRRVAAILSAAGIGVSAVQIAETLQRCAGLHEIAASDGALRPPIVDLVKAVDHPSIALSAACHRRRNESKVLAHLESARRDVDELLRPAFAYLPPEAKLHVADLARSIGHPVENEIDRSRDLRSAETAA